jgi:hypothetical protein
MCNANLPEPLIEEIAKPIEIQLTTLAYFPSLVYTIEKPEFLENVKAVANESLKKIRDEKPKLDPIYPVRMTGNLWDDPRMSDFCQYTASTAWNILESQGYNMSLYHTTFSDLWCQEHHKHSAMDQHVHGAGVQIVGFYFLETPKDSARPVIHDPRKGKVMINLPETNMSMATPASNMINFEPKEGLLIFTPAWLEHSFTRHASSKPAKFIHFNIGVIPAPQTVCVTTPPAEVI